MCAYMSGWVHTGLYMYGSLPFLRISSPIINPPSLNHAHTHSRPPHRKPISCLCVSPNGNYLATGEVHIDNTCWYEEQVTWSLAYENVPTKSIPCVSVCLWALTVIANIYKLTCTRTHTFTHHKYAHTHTHTIDMHTYAHVAQASHSQG